MYWIFDTVFSFHSWYNVIKWLPPHWLAFYAGLHFYGQPVVKTSNQIHVFSFWYVLKKLPILLKLISIRCCFIYKRMFTCVSLPKFGSFIKHTKSFARRLSSLNLSLLIVLLVYHLLGIDWCYWLLCNLHERFSLHIFFSYKYLFFPRLESWVNFIKIAVYSPFNIQCISFHLNFFFVRQKSSVVNAIWKLKRIIWVLCSRS